VKKQNNGNDYEFNLISTSFLVFVHIAAIGAFLPSNFSWNAVWLFVFLYWLTASVGICFGFHRLLAHRSCGVPLVVEWLIIFCGILACEGTPKKWIAHHRLHHSFSDTEKDPHNASKGFWWAHFKWMCYDNKKFDSVENIDKLAADICEKKLFRQFNNFSVIIGIQVVLGLLLFIIGGWSFVFWGIFLRLVIVWHATWLVNSAAHYFGYKNYDLPKPDRSTNCWWVGLLAFGEGWHNNHHKYARSARHGLRWFEIDMTWYFILLLRYIGLAKNINEARYLK